MATHSLIDASIGKRAGSKARSRYMVAEELMTASPFVVQVTDSIRRVMAQLMESDVRHLPVLDGVRLVGMVSDRDLRRLINPIFELAPASAAHRQDLEKP